MHKLYFLGADLRRGRNLATAGLALLAWVAPGAGALRAAEAEPAEPARYQARLEVVLEGYNGNTCWFHPRAGAIPGEIPTVVLTAQKLKLKHSDVYYPIASLESPDLGRTWTPIVEHTQTLGRRPLGEQPRGRDL